MEDKYIRQWGIDVIVIRSLDLDMIEKGIELWLMRWFCRIRFETTNGWTKEHLAIIDTGSPLCLVPQEIWKDCKIEIIADTQMYFGFSKDREGVPVKLGEVHHVIVNEDGYVNGGNVKAYLVLTSDIPLILGLDLIDHLLRIDMKG